jgi:hypothetical protein
MKAISITAMIFAVAAAFAVGWLTGGYGENRGGNGGRFRSAIWMVMDFAVRECHIPDYRHRLV